MTPGSGWKERVNPAAVSAAVNWRLDMMTKDDLDKVKHVVSRLEWTDDGVRLNPPPQRIPPIVDVQGECKTDAPQKLEDALKTIREILDKERAGV